MAKIPNNHHRGTCTRKSIHIRAHIHIHTLTHLHRKPHTHTKPQWHELGLKSMTWHQRPGARLQKISLLLAVRGLCARILQDHQHPLLLELLLLLLLLARTQHTRAAAEQQTAQVQLFPRHLQSSCAHLHDLWSSSEKWLPSAFKSTSGRCKASNVWGSCSGHSQCPHRCGRPWGLEHTVAKLWKR